MITRFIHALHAAQVDLTNEDIADILWLASHIDDTPVHKMTQELPQQPQRRVPSSNDPTLQQQQDTNKEHATSPETLPPSSTQQDTQGTIHLPSNQHSSTQQTQTGAIPFRSPAVPFLSRMLDLERALRPLTYRIPSRTHYVIDEALTAQNIAEQFLTAQLSPIPVLRPMHTRWLDIALVIDESPSMIIWRPVILEFKRLLERLGAFRDVRVWGLAQNQKQCISLRANWLLTRDTRVCSPRELADPGGRRLILIVSDCVSSLWYTAHLQETLTVWGSSGPLALLQVLPPRLWGRSALSTATLVQVHAERPGLPNIRLDYEPTSYLVQKRELARRMPLPVMSLSSESVRTWVEATMTASSTWSPGYVFRQQKALESQPNQQLSPEELLQRFSLAASPLARRLLQFLAATPISLPVIRLIQHKLLWESDLGHVAEVLCSGLIKQLSTNSEYYDFVPGVRDLLLNTMPKSELRNVLKALSKFIEKHHGNSIDFPALLADPTGKISFILDNANRPFAVVAAKILHRLGGKYREIAIQLETAATGISGGTTPYAQGKQQLLEGDLEGACALFYGAIQRNDSLESAVKDLVGVLIRLGRYSEAIQVLNKNRPKIKDLQSIDNLLIEIERYLAIELRFVQQRVEFSVASVQESHRRLQAIEANLYFDLDRKRVAELQRVLETMHDLCIQSTFEEKERLCLQIDSHCKDLWREIEADPTHLSVESFHPITQTIEAKTREYLEHLYESSAPRLVLHTPEGMTSYSYLDVVNPSVEVQIVVGNKAGCSPAEAIELVIQEDEIWFTKESPKIRLEEGSLRGGEQRIIRVPIRVTQMALQSQAFSLSLYAQYRTRSEDTKQTSMMETLSISLYSAERFEPVLNPYAQYAQGGIVGDEAMFYGRENLLRYISTTIYSSRTQSKAILIFGQKRSGKSSILHHLERRLQHFPDLLVFNLGSIGMYLDEHAPVPLSHQILWSILSRLNKGIAEEMQQGRPPLSIIFPSSQEFYRDPTPVIAFHECLISFHKQAEQNLAWRGTRLVLLIDEFSYLHGWIMREQLSEDFMKNWKALLQDNLFSAVLAGQDVMPKFKKHFPNELGSTQDLRVSYLSVEDARKLVDEPIRIGGKGGQSRYREHAIDRIIDLTAGSPFYIQIICDRLVEYMNRKCTPLVTEADVEQVKQELIHQRANPLGWDKFDNLTSSGDDSPDAITQEDARAVLKAIATNSRTGPCSRSRILVDTQKEIDIILQDLVQREVIETHPGNCYTIRVGLFKDWLLAHQ